MNRSSDDLEILPPERVAESTHGEGEPVWNTFRRTAVALLCLALIGVLVSCYLLYDLRSLQQREDCRQRAIYENISQGPSGRGIELTANAVRRCN